MNKLKTYLVIQVLNSKLHYVFYITLRFSVFTLRVSVVYITCFGHICTLRVSVTSAHSSRPREPGAAPRGTGGNSPPTPHKSHFCKSSKTEQKILGGMGVTSPTILEFQFEFVTSGFQRLDVTYILSNC